MYQPIWASTCTTFFNTKDLWGALRAKDMLITQDRSGMCGPTCIVNVTQAALYSVNPNLTLDPETSYEDLIREKKINSDGMALGEIADGLKYLLQRTAPELNIQVKAYGLKNKYNTLGVQKVEVIRPEHISPAQNKLVIIDVEIYDEFHQNQGRHVQVVRHVSSTGITIVEPRAPYENITLNLERKIKENPRYFYTPEPFDFGDFMGFRVRVIGYIEVYLK